MPRPRTSTVHMRGVQRLGRAGIRRFRPRGGHQNRPFRGWDYTIPYMVGKLGPNSSHLTRGLVKYVPGRCYFRAVPSLNGAKYATSPPPPNRWTCHAYRTRTHKWTCTPVDMPMTTQLTRSSKQMDIAGEPRATARTLSTDTARNSDSDWPRGPNHAGPMRAPRIQISPAWGRARGRRGPGHWIWPSHGPKPAQTYGGLVCTQDGRHPHTSSSSLEEMDHAGTQGPARSGRQGGVPINCHMATDRPTSPWSSPTHQPGWGGGPAYSLPPHTGWGRGAHTAPPPSPGFQPGHYTPPARGRGAVHLVR